jgi:hypothetical protein
MPHIAKTEPIDVAWFVRADRGGPVLTSSPSISVAYPTSTPGTSVRALFVRTEEPDDPTRRDAGRRAVQGHDIAVALGQIADLEHLGLPDLLPVSSRLSDPEEADRPTSPWSLTPPVRLLSRQAGCSRWIDGDRDLPFTAATFEHVPHRFRHVTQENVLSMKGVKTGC